MGMRDVYRKVAEKHGVSIEEVKRDMQLAIDETYKNPKNSELIKKLRIKYNAKKRNQLLKNLFFILLIW